MLAKSLDLRNALNHMVSVSDLGRGQASKVVNDVEKSKEQYIVVKNNKPQAVIISIDEYMDLMESKEELELVLMAQDRIKSVENSQAIDFEDILSEAGLTMSEIDKIKNDVELD